MNQFNENIDVVILIIFDKFLDELGLSPKNKKKIALSSVYFYKS
jgi:hypothetical protein